MEIDYEKNFHKAREVVAKGLIEKYGFVESYRDDYRLTLDSTNYSFHITFYTPKGDEIYVSRKNQKRLGNSFQDLVYDLNPKFTEVQKVYKRIFKSIANISESERFIEETILASFRIKFDFLSKEYSHFYN